MGPICFLAKPAKLHCCSSGAKKRNSSHITGFAAALAEHCGPRLAIARSELEMRSSKGWIALSLSLGLLAGGMPAQASEVVKLARLVVSGKRAATEPVRAAQPEQRTTPGNNQMQSSSGGGEDPGTAPAPARGMS
ncbi:hypothetical protein [Roseateles sp. LKC17W]|uniref:ESPR domain-containing protein n=1 Tax=Pelomonas margarita TaxID=3299031 RepID=A0ABW7FCF0_9BURK